MTRNNEPFDDPFDEQLDRELRNIDLPLNWQARLKAVIEKEKNASLQSTQSPAEADSEPAIDLAEPTCGIGSTGRVESADFEFVPKQIARRNSSYGRLVVAAAILAIVLAGGWWLAFHHRVLVQPISENAVQPIPVDQQASNHLFDPVDGGNEINGFDQIAVEVRLAELDRQIQQFELQIQKLELLRKQYRLTAISQRRKPSELNVLASPPTQTLVVVATAESMALAGLPIDTLRADLESVIQFESDSSLTARASSLLAQFN